MRIPLWAFLTVVAAIITGLLLILRFQKRKSAATQMTSYSEIAWVNDRGLDKTLSLLQQVQPFHYSIDGEAVHISP